MKRCFGYIRVSTAKQGEGVSLEAQKDAILAFAERNEIFICRWFEEKETAAKRGRPIFAAMIRLLKQGKADGLVIHKIDRSARNFADWAKIGDLSDAGIDVHFANESLDFRSRGGRLSADIQAVIAADYIRNLREETIKGIQGRLKQGLYPFKAPIGYLDNGKGKPKTPDPVKAPLVREMFELYASGTISIPRVPEEMAQRGLVSPTGQPVSKSCVEKTLRNPFYFGVIEIRRTGQTYQGIHKPIISAQLFETVQAVKAGKHNKKVTRHNHTFRGLFKCGLCQSAMTPELQKGHVYYRCHTPTCSTKTIREEVIDRAVSDVLAKHRMSERAAEELDQKFLDWLEKRSPKVSSETGQMHLARIDQRLETLSDKLIDGVIDDSTYRTKRKQFLLDRARIEQAGSTQSRNEQDVRRARKFLELAKSLHSTYQILPAGEKRQIVEITTSNRLVLDKSIDITSRNWLVAITDAVPVLCGAPARVTSRTGHEMCDAQVEEILALCRDENFVEEIETFKMTDQNVK